MSLLERPVHPQPVTGLPADERAARRTLRDQIARLELELVEVDLVAHPRLPASRGVAGRAGPRLLSLGELEAVRDDLADRARDLRATRLQLADQQARARLLVDGCCWIRAATSGYAWTNDDIGEPGCKSWHVRPRLGLIRHARRLVARQGLLRVPLSLGAVAFAAAPPRYHPTDRGLNRQALPASPRTGPSGPPTRHSRLSPRGGPRCRRPAVPGRAASTTSSSAPTSVPSRRGIPCRCVELSVLAGLVLLIVGVVNHDSSHGRIMMVFGLALASIAGLDTALREHFNGFRSHSSLLAAFQAVVAVTALGLGGIYTGSC